MLSALLLAESGSCFGAGMVTKAIRVGCPCLQLRDRRQSSQSASTSSSGLVQDASQSSTNGPQSAGRGFGFRTRLKDMTSTELQDLLARTEQAGGPVKLTDGPKKMAHPKPEHDSGQYAEQWTRLDVGIRRPYDKTMIRQTDIFAVIEAAHTQYKGETRRPHTQAAAACMSCRLVHLACLPEICIDSVRKFILTWFVMCSGARRQDFSTSIERR